MQGFVQEISEEESLTIHTKQNTYVSGSMCFLTCSGVTCAMGLTLVRANLTPGVMMKYFVVLKYQNEKKPLM